MLILGTNALEYKAILPYFIEHKIKQGEKVLIASFDDVLGPLISLSMNIGFKIDKLMKTKDILYFDFSDFGVEDMLQIEVPFVSKPPEMFVKSNIDENVENDINLIKNFLAYIEKTAAANGIQNLIITGIESSLILLDKNEKQVVLRDLNRLISYARGNKIDTIFGINRDCSDDQTDRYISSLISRCDKRLFFLENEGGFSKMITGQIMIDVDDYKTRSTNKKRIKYRLEDKKVEFFEKLEMS